MPVKKVVSKKVTKEAVVRVAESKPVKSGGLSVPVYSLVGAENGTLDLPRELFGAEVNQALLAQALRVYINNLKGHYGNTKTRGEVEGSTRKIYAQKGTGRARHGGIRAPLFVGGGRAMGPKTRIVILDLPKKMKKAALVSALSQKAKNNEVMALSNLDTATGKTKEIANLLKKLNRTSALFIVDKSSDSVKRSIKNLKNVSVMQSKELNAYEVIKHNVLFISKEAVDGLVASSKEQKSMETK